MTGSTKRVLLIGPAPANYGGVSMHMRRLAALMSGLCEFDYIDEGRKRYNEYFNLRSLNLFTYFKKVSRADVVHINSGSFLLRMFNVLMCCVLMHKYTVVTVHRDPARERYRGLTRWLLSHCNVVVAVSDNGLAMLQTPGKCRYVHLPAFLPPDVDCEPPLSHEISSWIDSARIDDDAVVMVSNASNLIFNNGQDLYGIDLCLQAMKSLCASGRSYYLVFVVVQCDNSEVLDGYKKYINENGLEDNVLMLLQPCSFVRLMQQSDIVLRATNTDGDSITVREAISLGVPVIASDCVARPEGTILFKSRDVGSLVDAIRTVPRGGEAVADDTDYIFIYSRIYNL